LSGYLGVLGEENITDDVLIFATKPEMNVLARPNASGKLELSGFGKEYLYLRRNGYPSGLKTIMKNLLNDIVQRVLGQLIESFGFQVASIADDEVLIHHPKCMLLVTREREGATIAFIDHKEGAFLLYPLGVYLATRRQRSSESVVSPSCDDRVESELRWYLNVLTDGAKDILEGDRKWLTSYPWKPLPVRGSHEEIFSSLLTK